MNKHVNSIKYLEWVYDCLPIEILTSYSLSDLNINYIHEIPANKEVEISYSELSQEPLKYAFSGKIMDSNKTSFLMELTFCKN